MGVKRKWLSTTNERMRESEYCMVVRLLHLSELVSVDVNPMCFRPPTLVVLTRHAVLCDVMVVVMMFV